MAEIMQIEGWKTKSMTRHYIGPATSERLTGAKRQREQACSDALDLPLSPECAREILLHAHRSIPASYVSLGTGEVPGLQAAGPKERGKKFG